MGKEQFLKNVAARVKRLIPSCLIAFLPFLVFGTGSDIKLMLWKVAVVGTGLLLFHFARKSMFPYIDIGGSYSAVREAVDSGKAEALPLAILAFAESLLIATFLLAVLFSVAGGI